MLKAAIATSLLLISVKWWRNFDFERYSKPNIGSISDFVKSHGYPIETHEAYTQDGYILTMHHIPRGRNELPQHPSNRKPAVLLMHGLLLSSIDWVILGPDKAMGLVLADAGYDVWIGNNRGNTHSRRHRRLDPRNNKKQFFNYSYHEIGMYDIPAMIDYVLMRTRQDKISYIGFSQGVTSFLVMSSLKPEYNQKILVMNAWAPVTDMYNTSSFIFNTLEMFPLVLQAAEFIKWFEMFDISTAPVFRALCRASTFICDGLFGLIGASDAQMPDKEFQLTALSNFPAGMSLKQMQHFIQGCTTGIFAPYNQNYSLVQKRNSYDLTKVTAPIIFYYGEDDNLVSHYLLLNKVVKSLPNVYKVFKVPYPHFNHLDFLWGKDTRLLTEETLSNINYFNKRSKD